MQPVAPVAAARIVATPRGALAILRRQAHPANYSRRIRNATQAIVIHATDGHEGPSKAEDVAAMFASPLESPRSAHFAVDTDSVVQCVSPELTAWHCGRTGNLRCEGVELCGRASQTREQWFDALSLPMLNLAAALVASRCAARGIDPVFADRAGLRVGRRGITTHAEVSIAWRESSHTDPGPHFPLAEFIEAVRIALPQWTINS